MGNILGDIIESIKERWGEIVVGVVIIIILLLTMSLYGFSFEDINGKDEKDSEKSKVTDTIEIVYEGMYNKFDELCESDDLENLCKRLSKGKQKSCNTVNCCVWAENKNGGACVEGDELGPMIKADKDKLKYDEYYYLNKKFKLK